MHFKTSFSYELAQFSETVSLSVIAQIDKILFGLRKTGREYSYGS